MYAYTIICILNTIEKNAPTPKTINRPPPFSPAQLLRFFLQLLPHRALRKLPALQALTFYERLFTPLVTLWYLLFQWLNSDHTLDAVVTDARAGGADRLNRRLSRKLVSSSTGPYSDARRRLPVAFLAQALRLQGSRLTGQSPTTLWKAMVVSLLDGSTVRLRPYGDIPKEFPPHGNQHQKRTYWCLMRVVVSFCGWTGAALDCALGSTHLSEQALGGEIMLRAAGHCLFLADRNFGVFRIVQAARHAHQHVLLRMTDVRAAKLLGGALRIGDFEVLWKPTRHDQLQPTCSPDPVQGRLIIRRLERPGFRGQWLCLFTTLTDRGEYPPTELVQLYERRWHVELDLRYVKAQMEAGQLEVHSAEMARKQWLACLLAYNLIRAAMLCAALQQNIPPLTLSFSACRRRLELWLHDFGRTPGDVLVSWNRTLAEIGKCRLPRRKKPRPNEPRAKRHVRESFPPLIGARVQARKKLKNYATKS
jgi:IS4 transposase